MELFHRNESYLNNCSVILIPQVMGSVSKAFQKRIKNLLPDYFTNFSNLKQSNKIIFGNMQKRKVFS